MLKAKSGSVWGRTNTRFLPTPTPTRLLFQNRRLYSILGKKGRTDIKFLAAAYVNRQERLLTIAPLGRQQLCIILFVDLLFGFPIVHVRPASLYRLANRVDSGNGVPCCLVRLSCFHDFFYSPSVGKSLCRYIRSPTVVISFGWRDTIRSITRLWIIILHLLYVSPPIIDDDRDCPLADNPRQPHLHSGRRLLQVRIQQPFWQVS